MTKFLDLIDDVLIKVIDYCDVETLVSVSRTCKRLNALVSMNHFPQCTKFSCEAGTTVDVAVIKNVGKYLIELNVCFGELFFDYSGSNISSYYHFLVDNIGENIRILKIRFEFFTTPLQILKPVLQRLDELELTYYGYFDVLSQYSEDVAALCPDLRKLKIDGLNRLPLRGCKFNGLEELIIQTDYQYDFELQEFTEFLKKNPHIKRVDLSGWNDCIEYVNITDLVTHLIHLEDIRIYASIIRNFLPETLLHLSQLHKLQSIKVNHVKQAHLNEILANLAQLKNLRRISLDVAGTKSDFMPCQQSILEIAGELQQLQYFRIRSSKYILWKGNTAIDFIRLAYNLQDVFIQQFQFKVTPDFIRKLANARKSLNKIDRPLKLHFEERFADHVVMVTKEEDVKRFLIVYDRYRRGYRQVN